MDKFDPPRSQGLKSSTFVQPPYDPALNLPTLYEWQGERSPQHPLFVFQESYGSQRVITWGEATRGFHRASRYLRDTVKYPGKGAKPFIAVLATPGEHNLAAVFRKG